MQVTQIWFFLFDETGSGLYCLLPLEIRKVDVRIDERQVLRTVNEASKLTTTIFFDRW